MYAGYGDGHEWAGCGEVIDATHVEYEAVYEGGPSYRLHLGCGAFRDALRRRLGNERAVMEATSRIREASQATREDAQAIRKESGQLRDQADVLARVAEAAREYSKRARREPTG
jgi:hypothetical protein